MKKSIIAVLMTFIFLLLGGCSEMAKPEDTVGKYLSASQNMDFEAMAATILPSNKDAVDMTTTLMEDEENDYTKYFFDYLKANAQKITYTIGKSEVDGDKAIVTVSCKYVDGGPLLKATIGEVFTKALGMALTGIEMTDEETAQMFTSIMEEQCNAIDETFKEATINVNCVKKNDKWYVSEVNEELLDVVMSGFISTGKELSDTFGEDSEETENIVAEEPVEELRNIESYVVGDLWNDGFCEISYYLVDGTGSMGQELDIDFTKSQLDKAMEKKNKYDEYIAGLDDSYADIKEVWNKLSPEIDVVYQEVQTGASELNTDLFNQYMSAFSDLVYELE